MFKPQGSQSVLTRADTTKATALAFSGTEEKLIRVLLIDDQAIVNEAIRRMLTTEADIACYYCSDPAEAIHVATEVGPTIILQDLVMPDADGLELVNQFRSQPTLQEVPIIVLSTRDDAQTKARCFGLGANDYLVKLPDKIELIARIRYHSQAYLDRQQLHHVAKIAQTKAVELERTLDQLSQTQAQLIQTEKLSSLGQMLAGVAHEINNPLAFLWGNLAHIHTYMDELLKVIQVYQQHAAPVPEIESYLEAIDYQFIVEDLPSIMESTKMGAERITQIVLSLRNFSRQDQTEMTSVNIHEGINSTLLILNHRLKDGIEVIKEFGALPFVECYPAQLNQVFMNILSNAIDALSDQEALGHKQIVIRTEMVSQNSIQIRIRDSGPGIAPEICDRLFHPFVTTKPVGKGTGLGLPICRQIVEKHNGKLEVISEPGQGAEFIIRLAVCQSSL